MLQNAQSVPVTFVTQLYDGRRRTGMRFAIFLSGEHF